MPSPTRILIVEDEEILAQNMRQFLSRRTPEVRIACDADHATEILESFTPDLVVLDFALPGMDGLQTYAVIIRHKAPQASCIMVSGHMSEDVINSAGEHGIRHVLCKPFSFAELQEKIDLSLSNSLPTAARTGTAEPANMRGVDDAGRATNRRREDRRRNPDRRGLYLTAGQGA